MADGINVNRLNSNSTYSASGTQNSSENIDCLFEQAQIIKANSTQGDSANTVIPMEDLYRQLGGINLNYDALRKAGAHFVTSMALLALTKGQGVIRSIQRVGVSLSSELNSIINNKNLTDEQKEEKIKDVQSRALTAQKEASSKLAVLTMLSDSVFKLYKLTAKLKNSGAGTSEMASTLTDLIKGVNVNISDYSGIKGEEELNKKLTENMHNIYGSKSDEKLQEKKEDLERKIKKLQEKLEKENLTKEEAEKIGSQIIIYNFELTVLSSILETIHQFDPEEKSN